MNAMIRIPLSAIIVPASGIGSFGATDDLRILNTIKVIATLLKTGMPVGPYGGVTMKTATKNTRMQPFRRQRRWALSSIFIWAGFRKLHCPLLSVTVGLAASAVGFGSLLLFKPQDRTAKNITGEIWFFKMLARLLVGMSTWAC
jgi:hypothetical protein